MLEAVGISKRYGGVLALNKMHFAADGGEVGREFEPLQWIEHGFDRGAIGDEEVPRHARVA